MQKNYYLKKILFENPAIKYALKNATYIFHVWKNGR